MSIVSLAHGQVPNPQKAPGALKAERCGPGTCTITVNVLNCNEPSGVRIDKPLVRFDDSALIVWKIDSAGQAFEEIGVRIAGDDPSEPVFQIQPASLPNEFRILNRNSVMGEFDYRYTLQIKGCKPIEGWIRNVAL